MGRNKKIKQMRRSGAIVKPTPEERRKVFKKRWLSEMFACLPSGFRPDMGHIQFSLEVETEHLSFTGTIRVMKDSAGAMVLINSDDPSLGNPCWSLVVRRVHPFFDVLESTLNLNMMNVLYDVKLESNVKPLPSERYRAAKGEWVLPWELDVLSFYAPRVGFFGTVL